MLHTVAKLHYEADLSQVEIARRLNVSAPTISRLLRRAREEGIVRIEIPDIETPEELNRRLIQTLGLKHAAVVEAPEANLLGALAGPVGQMLREAGLRRDSVLAIGWGRAVRAVIEAGLPEIEGVITVPATGGMQQSAPHFQINEFVRLAAEQLKGTPRFIHAPYLPSPESRDAFLSDPIIHENVALWERLDAALVGIGLTHTAEGASSATPHEQALAQAAGDVVRHYFDLDGALVPWEGESRLIAVTPDQLRATPLVIGVAVSTRKVPAIRGAVRAGLVNALVTDVRTAQAVLEGA